MRDAGPGHSEPSADWRRRLETIVDLMRELSRQTDPQTMVRTYGQRVRSLYRSDGFIALSRRDLDYPRFRVTRYTGWTEEVNPWDQPERLPLLEGGILAELIYGDQPRLIDDLTIDPADPAAPYLAGYRSLAAIPNYDRGIALNLVALLRRDRAGFPPEDFPDLVWTSNLFGRATHALVLADRLQKATDAAERELKVVADIQRSLLPTRLPEIPRLDLAAFYQTSKYAGGDYYDVFRLADNLWGLLIADVSGHGTPAAVIMAITHSLAHAYAGPTAPPGRLLSHINDCLAAHYTSDAETFVTAFYALYDPSRRTLTYASAGHNPPRLFRKGGAVESLDGARSLPLGILPGQVFSDETTALGPGDQLLFYTDGITEAVSPEGEMYGLDRLDAVVARCHGDAQGMVDAILTHLGAFTAGQPPADDQTLLAAKIH